MSDLFGKDEYFRLVVESQHNVERSIEHMEDFIKYIQDISPDEDACTRKIISLGKYDALTVLTYFRELLAEMHEFIAEELDMPPVPALKWLRSAGTIEFAGDIIEHQIKPEDMMKFLDNPIDFYKSLELAYSNKFELSDGAYDTDILKKSPTDVTHDGESSIQNNLLNDDPERFKQFVNERVMLSFILNYINGTDKIQSFFPRVKEKRKESIKNSFLNVKKIKEILKKSAMEALFIYLSDFLSFLDDCIGFYLYKERKINYIPLSQHLFETLF